MGNTSSVSYPGVPTRSYDDKAIEANMTCIDSGRVGRDFCVYTEKMEGERVATRSVRVLKLAEVGPHEKIYVGDIDGDGIADRYVENLDLEGNGPGRVEFGSGDTSYTTQVPAVFRNASGREIALHDDVTVTHPYDSSFQRERVEAFEVRPDTRREAGASQYLLVSVNVLAGNGEMINIDQCAPR